jgi:hypothetical protein
MSELGIGVIFLSKNLSKKLLTICIAFDYTLHKCWRVFLSKSNLKKGGNWEIDKASLTLLYIHLIKKRRIG